MPKIGDMVEFRPAPGSSLRIKVRGVFKGMTGNYVRVDSRKYRLSDIHGTDREPFVRYRNFMKADE